MNLDTALLKETLLEALKASESNKHIDAKELIERIAKTIEGKSKKA